MSSLRRQAPVNMDKDEEYKLLKSHSTFFYGIRAAKVLHSAFTETARIGSVCITELIAEQKMTAMWLQLTQFVAIATLFASDPTEGEAFQVPRLFLQGLE